MARRMHVQAIGAGGSGLRAGPSHATGLPVMYLPKVDRQPTQFTLVPGPLPDEVTGFLRERPFSHDHAAMR